MTAPDPRRLPIVAQLENELGQRARALSSLVGLDLGDIVVERIEARSLRWADQLNGADGAVGTAVDIMAVLWPHGSPDELDPGWWRTPLGIAVARCLGPDSDCSITHSTAAAILGVSRGTIGVLVHRGTLDRHPDGGVDRASVLRRLTRTRSSPHGRGG